MIFALVVKRQAPTPKLDVEGIVIFFSPLTWNGYAIIPPLRFYLISDDSCNSQRFDIKNLSISQLLIRKVISFVINLYDDEICLLQFFATALQIAISEIDRMHVSFVLVFELLVVLTTSKKMRPNEWHRYSCF